jgi:hypothetical protein
MVGPWRLQKEVVVVRQQAVGKADPVSLADHLRQATKKDLVVRATEEDLRTGVAAGSYVVDEVCALNACRARHALTVRLATVACLLRPVTPL